MGGGVSKTREPRTWKGSKGEIVYTVVARSYFVPLWLCFVSFGMLPFVQIARRMRRSYRERRGFCLNCGYDLRASEGKCPECGAAAK